MFEKANGQASKKKRKTKQTDELKERKKEEQHELLTCMYSPTTGCLSFDMHETKRKTTTEK